MHATTHRHDCCLCRDTGTNDGCPGCGAVYVPSPVTIALNAAQRRLAELGTFAVACGNGYARVRKGGKVVAEARGNKLVAIAEVVRMVEEAV